MKILKSIVYAISQLEMFGGREIAQGGGKIFPKVSATILSVKFHKNATLKITVFS